MNRFLFNLVENPWQVLGWLVLAVILLYALSQVWSFFRAALFGTIDFIRHLYWHRKTMHTAPSVGQHWVDGLESEYVITNVFGPNAEEGVGLELRQHGKVFSGSLSKQA